MKRLFRRKVDFKPSFLPFYSILIPFPLFFFSNSLPFFFVFVADVAFTLLQSKLKWQLIRTKEEATLSEFQNIFVFFFYSKQFYILFLPTPLFSPSPPQSLLFFSFSFPHIWPVGVESIVTPLFFPSLHLRIHW